MYPERYPVTLVATLKDGKQVTAHVDYPEGDPENPVTLQDILDKFNYLTEKYSDKVHRDTIVDKVKKLDQMANVAELGQLLC